MDGWMDGLMDMQMHKHFRCGVATLFLLQGQFLLQCWDSTGAWDEYKNGCRLFTHDAFQTHVI